MRDSIKELKRRTGRKIPDLLALLPENDPFNCGAPADILKAEWFKAMWDKHHIVTSHTRRIHYKLVVASERRHDGKIYLNTAMDAKYLQEASVAARWLGLVSADAFRDHRNPEAIIYGPLEPEFSSTPFVHHELEELLWLLPSIRADLGSPSLLIPDPKVTGYWPDAYLDAPYLVEIWIEKSTMDDVLLPLCEELKINCVRFSGSPSITRATEFLARVQRTEKPGRILYLSDYDKNGDNMPMIASRHLEFMVRSQNLNVDIAVNALAITPEQIVKYKLPRVPAKATHPGLARFEASHGQGAVELDALEGLHPGELERLVREAVAPYQDPNIGRRLDQVRDETDDLVDEAWEEVIKPVKKRLNKIRAQVRGTVQDYETRLRELNTDLQTRLKPLRAQLEPLQKNIRAEAARFRPEVPDRPKAKIKSPNEKNWLFHSDRDYEAQLDVYNAYKNRFTARKVKR